MKIETFLNGELFGESEVEDFELRPNVSGFITQMFFSDSYMKLKNIVSNKDPLITIELLAVRLELKPVITRQDLEIIKLLWDGIIEFLPEGILLESDGDSLKYIAESNRMPFSFDDFFKINILIEE